MARDMPTYSAHTLKDFEPESFVLEKYIEKLAQLDPNTGLGPLSKKKGMPFDPKVLLESFQVSLDHLQDLNDKIHKRVEKLEFVCAKQERDHVGRVRELEPMFHGAFEEFQVLEDRITYVARKVVHLGDQLESSNSHRQRDIEAQRLMEIMTEFETKSKPSRPEFTDPTRLPEAADLINKLNALASELPRNEQYHFMRQNIATKYVDIEKQLVDKFYEAMSASDVKRMRLYASTLQNFPEGANKCIVNYVSHHVANLSSTGSSYTEDMFRNVETRSAKVYKQMTEVFDAPEDVMMKYIQQSTEKYLFDHVSRELQDTSKNVESYLNKLYGLHMRAMILRDTLAKLDAKFDPVFLTKTLRVTLFSEHLAGYAESEVKHLEQKCHQLLEEFNSLVGIQKKSNGVANRAATHQTVIDSVTSPEEAFISENVCTSVLTESKHSIKRCQELLMDRELSHAMREIFHTVLAVLCGDHFTVALDLALDIKIGPPGLFLQVVGCINKNVHLIEKQFRDIILPTIQYAPVAAACNDKKRERMTKLEAKIETGVEKSIANMVTVLSQILSNQKKTDYKPEEPGIPETSAICLKAVNHITQCTKVIKISLDGKNQEVILLEFGIRVHRILYEHILTFTVNSIGAMYLICDVNEYRKVFKEFENPYLDEVFENLQTLCNLFIVMPENLKQVCSEEPYVSFDRNVIMRTIQLRADYKSAKIGKIFHQ